MNEHAQVNTPPLPPHPLFRKGRCDDLPPYLELCGLLLTATLFYFKAISRSSASFPSLGCFSMWVDKEEEKLAAVVGLQLGEQQGALPSLFP